MTGLVATDWNNDGITDFVVGMPDGRVMLYLGQPLPTLSISDTAPVLEGNNGSITDVTFTVTLSSPITQVVFVNWATADGTATAAGSDYMASSGMLFFLPGNTTKTLTVPVIGDNTLEPDETFLVNLTNPINATLGDSQGQGTILNDDGVPPTISLTGGSSVSISNGDNTPRAGDGSDFGVILPGGTASTHTFTVQNTGQITLLLGGTVVPAGFKLLQDLPASIAPGGSASFTVSLDTSVQGVQTGSIYIASNDGYVVTGSGMPSTFSFAVTGITLGTQWSVVGTGDMNGDGKQDLIWRNPSTTQNIVQLMDGAAHSTGTVILPRVSHYWVLGGVGDFNTDGNSDLLWRNVHSGVNSIWLMDGSGGISGYSSLPSVVRTSQTIAGVGDLSGDGHPGVLWLDTSRSLLTFWRVKGAKIIKMAISPAAAPARSVVAGIGDMNGDSKADILWRQTTTGQASVWLMNRTTRSSTQVIGGVGSTTSQVIGLANLIGTADKDILVRDPSTGIIKVWTMSGLTPGQLVALS
jgi:hypothetical protein